MVCGLYDPPSLTHTLLTLVLWAGVCCCHCQCQISGSTFTRKAGADAADKQYFDNNNFMHVLWAL